ncbi:MAG: hypothetical protein B6U76_01590 [Desulfurococcales archaeon ex4484_217_2]|nr:MAG: hypothetical protein B6U76_01590 [Desulfurococcales archaeon ex4484_217_2]
MYISTIERLLTSSAAALILEAAATPKPGNVHKYHSYEDMGLEHFIVSASASIWCFRKLLIATLNSGLRRETYVPGIGETILCCVRNSRKWHRGGNVNLGTSTIFSILLPSIFLTEITYGKVSLESLSSTSKAIVEKTTVDDAVKYYEAIRVASPRYLGRVNNAPIPDVYDEKYEFKIRSNNITLHYVLKYASTEDIVSRTCVNGLKEVIEGYHYLEEFFRRYGDINNAIVLTYLKLLSKYDDFIVLRKHGKTVSSYVKNRASKIIKLIEEDFDKGFNLLKEFDNELFVRKINPGSIADLTAASIVLALFMGKVKV